MGISDNKYWCPVKDEEAPKGFRRVYCSESCPRVATIEQTTKQSQLSPKEITEELKTSFGVFSNIDKGRNCGNYLASFDLAKVG